MQSEIIPVIVTKKKEKISIGAVIVSKMQIKFCCSHNSQSISLSSRIQCLHNCYSGYFKRSLWLSLKGWPNASIRLWTDIVRV